MCSLENVQDLGKIYLLIHTFPELYFSAQAVLFSFVVGRHLFFSHWHLFTGLANERNICLQTKLR